MKKMNLGHRLNLQDNRAHALAQGIENGFIQEGETAGESFIPAFDGTGIDKEDTI